MRIVRYVDHDGNPRFGWARDNRIGPIEGSPFREFRRLEADRDLEDTPLLAPVQPSKIICVGRNYAAHAKEHDAEVPEVPLLFLKPPSAVTGHNQPVLLPPQSQQVEHEGELVVVIGRRGRWIPGEEALDYVLGYTIGNDVTARDLQYRDGQWTRGKGFDTFCPLGPWIETELEPNDTMLYCRVNGGLRQMASTNEMVFSVSHLIAYASSVMTLEPGDVLFTGTPAGVGPLSDGDMVEVTIDGLGTLSNPVRLEKLP